MVSQEIIKMKVLNRPMFRYGGPIKEGIMSGIKEPRRQGYALPPGLVIQNDPNKMTTNKMLQNAEAFMKAGQVYDQDLNNQGFKQPPIKKITAPKKNIFNTTDEIGSNVLDSDFATTKIVDGKVVTIPPKGYIGYEPGIDETTKEFIKGLGEPGVSEGYLKAKARAEGKNQTLKFTDADDRRQQFSAGDVKLPGDKDDTPPPPPTRKEKVNSILESLGYDRAQKNALYDAMIKAGQRISRTGLGADNLVSDIIAETSQSYDKPEKLREAANLMQAQQDLKLEQIKASKEGTGTMNQNYNYFKNRGYSDADAARKAEGLATNLLEAKSIGMEKQKLKGNKLTEYVAQQLVGIEDAYDNNTYRGTIDSKEHKSVSDFVKSTDFDGAGVYTVKGRIIELDENGKILKEEIVTSSTSDKKWWNFGREE